MYTIASTSALGAAAAASSGVLSTALPYRETEAPKEKMTGVRPNQRSVAWA